MAILSPDYNISFPSSFIRADDSLAIQAQVCRNEEMSFKALSLVSLLCLFPLLGYAQSDAFALQRILQRYTETYGGFRDAKALTSLSVEGTIRQDGQSYDFLVRKKRPDSIRYRLSQGANQVDTGFDGVSCWLRMESGGEVSIAELEGAAARALREQARFESPLFRHLEKRENTINLVERTVFNDSSVFVLKVSEPSGRISRYYLDARTAHLLRHDRLDDSGAVLFQTLYRDYREVEGYPFAHEVENRAGGETVSLVQLKTIEVNPGLLSFYFETPRH